MSTTTENISSIEMARTVAASTNYPPRTPDDYVEPVPPLESTQAEIDRWNTEWVRYLGREWQHQLLPHTAYPLSPEFPDRPIDALRLSFNEASKERFAVYADKSALTGKRVMELGCGCGNMGKFMARYVKHYLGVDFSPLALAVARLVSPSNTTYVQVADRPNLQPFFGNVDTVISRYFWIHQNAKLARYNLDYLANFLVPGGRLYADFCWPNLDIKQGRVYSPYDPLSKAFPSAMFCYTLDDVNQLIAGTRYSIVREEVHPPTQRRYVVLEAL